MLIVRASIVHGYIETAPRQISVILFHTVCQEHAECVRLVLCNMLAQMLCWLWRSMSWSHTVSHIMTQSSIAIYRTILDSMTLWKHGGCEADDGCTISNIHGCWMEVLECRDVEMEGEGEGWRGEWVSWHGRTPRLHSSMHVHACTSLWPSVLWPSFSR